MAGPAARQQQDEVEPLLVLVIARPPRQPIVGGNADAGRLARAHRRLDILAGEAALHLDEGEPLAAHGDDVDLAGARFHVAAEDAVALGHERRRGQRLGEAATTQARPPLVRRHCASFRTRRPRS